MNKAIDDTITGSNRLVSATSFISGFSEKSYESYVAKLLYLSPGLTAHDSRLRAPSGLLNPQTRGSKCASLLKRPAVPHPLPAPESSVVHRGTTARPAARLETGTSRSVCSDRCPPHAKTPRTLRSPGYRRYEYPRHPAPSGNTHHDKTRLSGSIEQGSKSVPKTFFGVGMVIHPSTSEPRRRVAGRREIHGAIVSRFLPMSGSQLATRRALVHTFPSSGQSIPLQRQGSCDATA